MPKTDPQIGRLLQPVKLCLRCRETKEASLFYKDRSKPDGLQSQCTKCRQEIKGITQRRREQEARRDQREADKVAHSAFNTHWRGVKAEWMKSGYYTEWAKAVHLEQSNQWAKDNPEAVKAKSKRWRERNPEKVKENQKRWERENREAILQRKSEYREKNRERITIASREWRERNLDKVKAAEKIRRSSPSYKEKAKAYYQANRRECIRRSTEWSRNYRKTPMGTMENRLRVRLNDALRRGGYTKRSRTTEIIGCSWLMLVDHIEKQFLKGMTWENRGDWHIDHVIPLSSAQSVEELESLSHFSNLKPMWAEDNMAKGDRIIDCQPELLLNH